MEQGVAEADYSLASHPACAVKVDQLRYYLLDTKYSLIKIRLDGDLGTATNEYDVVKGGGILSVGPERYLFH